MIWEWRASIITQKLIKTVKNSGEIILHNNNKDQRNEIVDWLINIVKGEYILRPYGSIPEDRQSIYWVLKFNDDRNKTAFLIKFGDR